jgi:hypothetical protein
VSNFAFDNHYVLKVGEKKDKNESGKKVDPLSMSLVLVNILENN